MTRPTPMPYELALAIALAGGAEKLARMIDDAPLPGAVVPVALATNRVTPPPTACTSVPDIARADTTFT